MRRVMFCILIICLLCGCSAQSASDNATSEVSNVNNDGWTVEDFYVYDKGGDLYNYPFNSELKFYDNLEGIRNYYEELGEKNLELHTKRGVCAHASAKVVFESINLDNFDIDVTNWPYLGSLSEEQKKTKQDYLSKYSDKYQAIKHSTELPKDLSLYISVDFYDDGTGKLISYPAGISGLWWSSDRMLSKNQYSLICYVKNDYIFEWHIEHHEAYLTDEEYDFYKKITTDGYKTTDEEYERFMEIAKKLGNFK